MTKKAMEGYLFTLFRELINWQLTKQKLVIKSSTKSELLVLLYTAIKSI